MSTPIESWGRYPKATPAKVARLTDRNAPLPNTDLPTLVFGNGRSYGDVCLNNGGQLLLGRSLDRFIAFDAETGVLRAEAGVLLSEILDIVVPKGWFLPVTPGTRFVTLGGAVANDVHGKNHHRAGTFGHHVRALELVRSDGSRRVCSPTENAEWLAATVGGLGLTGLITWVEIQLRAIQGPWIQAESRRFANLREFFHCSEASDRDHEFTVAWVDCAARGEQLGRGVFLSGDFATTSAGAGKPPKAHGALDVPLSPPFSLINQLSLKAFNALYFRKPEGNFLTHYAPFFYPLDSIGHWNRVYGPKGFLQYQCVLPPANAEQSLQTLLTLIAASGQGSFLAVLKRFGSKAPIGMLSFPREGFTIALDFPLLGPRTLSLLDRLDAVVLDAGGTIYPAKDARMTPAIWAAQADQRARFRPFVDPAFRSSFSERCPI
jgi:FAD/FMN-containing dehydrogenase